MKSRDSTREQLTGQFSALHDKINNLEKTVAALRQTEEALITSEKNLSAILEKNADGIVIVNTEGKVLYVNPAAEKLFDRNKEDFLGYPFGIPLSTDKTADTLIIKKNGVLCDAELRVVHVQWQKQPAFQLSVRDITDRKKAEEKIHESEEKYRSIYENSNIGILLTVPDGTILAANDFACELFGMTEEEVCHVGREIITDKTDPRLQTLLEERKRKGRAKGELTFIRKDKTTFEGEISSAIFLDRNGKEKSSMTIQDLTERKRAEEEIKKLNESLEQKVIERTAQFEAATKAKSEFLANMSHEIRTPMNSILGYTELLISTLTDQTQKNYIESIKSSGRSLLTLINDILDLSKIEAGKLELEFGFVNANSFFTEFERIFALNASEKGIKFTVEIDADTPAGIFVDESRLRQIVFNLVGNAIKFTNKGYVKLIVYTQYPGIIKNKKNKSVESIVLIIEVQDTGIGISKEFRKELFDPFVQASDHKNLGGTGLGLAITLRLTSLMNGTIDVKSEPGKGSTFTVKIPGVAIKKDFYLPDVKIQIDPAEVIFEIATLLIIDEVEQNRSYIRDVLKNSGITVIEAEDYKMGYKLAKSIVPNLVITDIRLPKMDGFHFLNKIKANKKLKNIPVIAYSASVLKEQKELIHQNKFAGLLVKPVKVTELYSEIMNFLPYKLAKETKSHKPVSNAMDADGLINLPELRTSLETNFLEIWKSFEIRQPIAEIRLFGENLISLGNNHNSSLIKDYGKDLKNAANTFNIRAILRLIKQYPVIIENLKNIK